MHFANVLVVYFYATEVTVARTLLPVVSPTPRIRFWSNTRTTASCRLKRPGFSSPGPVVRGAKPGSPGTVTIYFVATAPDRHNVFICLVAARAPSFISLESSRAHHGRRTGGGLHGAHRTLLPAPGIVSHTLRHIPVTKPLFCVESVQVLV